MPLGLQELDTPTISRQSAHEGGRLGEIALVFISVRG